jgi:hypothetical protein
MATVANDLGRLRRGIAGMGRRANPAFAVGAVVVPIAALTAAIVVGDLQWLLYVHVLAGALWTGIDVFMGGVLGPVLGGLDPEKRAAFFATFTPKMTFLLPTLANVTIAGGIVTAMEMGYFSNALPWLALFTAVTVLPIVVLIAVQFDALTHPRTLVILGVALVGSGAFVATTIGDFAMTNHWIAAALAIVALLTIGGFGLLLPGEVRIYRQITSEEPDVDVIGQIGMRNAKLGGIQGVLQLAIVFVMVGLRL